MATLDLWGRVHPAPTEPVSLLNVSYDPTRELYRDYNEAFCRMWQSKTGQTVSIRQSHGGAGKQARAVMDGLQADVLTLALAWDMDMISRKTGLFPANWAQALPHKSCPYTSTIVFLVRKGNPRHIRDWSDLIRPGVEVITPNPKTSGGARWNYLAAWGAIAIGELGAEWRQAPPEHLKKAHAKARAYITSLFRHVPVLDTGARGATNTFVQRGLGDVLLAWENEALLAREELGSDSFDIVVPSWSILAEPPVTVVTAHARKHGTLQVAQAYLEYLYSPEGQKLAARHHYRPVHPEWADPADMKTFPKVCLFELEDIFVSWEEAQKNHFQEGGVFDQITAPSAP